MLKNSKVKIIKMLNVRSKQAFLTIATMKLKIILKSFVVIALLSFTTIENGTTNQPPSKEDFIDLKELMPNLRSDLRYYGSNN